MTPEDAKAASRGVSTDMSPRAIARRLEIVGELYALSKLLSTARRTDADADPAVRGAGRPGADRTAPGTS